MHRSYGRRIQRRTSGWWSRCIPMLLRYVPLQSTTAKLSILTIRINLRCVDFFRIRCWFGPHNHRCTCFRCHERSCWRWIEYSSFRQTIPRLQCRLKGIQCRSASFPHFRSTRCRLHAHIGRRRQRGFQASIQSLHFVRHPCRWCKYSFYILTIENAVVTSHVHYKITEMKVTVTILVPNMDHITK